MDADAVIIALTGVASVTGGYFGGKRIGNNQAQQAAVGAVELLTLAVAELRTQGQEKDSELADLRGRVSVLEDLVTQRAEVEVVKTIVEKIATKVGA